MSINTAEIITKALRYKGILGVGDGGVPNADDSSMALSFLQSILRSWSREAQNNYQTYNVSVPSTMSDSKFYMSLGADADGNAGDFAVNPCRIDQVTAELGPAVYRMPILSLAEYEQQPSKFATGAPQFCAWDYGYPQSKLYFWPLAASGYTIRVMGLPYLPIPQTAQDVLSLPDWYDEPLWLSLAASLDPVTPDASRSLHPEELYRLKEAMSNLHRFCGQIRRPHFVTAYPGRKSPGGLWTSQYSPWGR